MSNFEILEVAESLKRTSHRVRNSGDIILAEIGLKLAKKAKRQRTPKHAREIETEYLWILKDKYLPILPTDKKIATITMSEYDDATNPNDNSQNDNTNSNHENVITHDDLNRGEYIIVVENLNSQHEILTDHIDTDHYSPKEGEQIIVTKDIQDKLDAIAKDYYEATGKPLIITDGIREPEDQAKAMFNKLESGEDLNKLYANKEALNDVLEAYKEATESGKSHNEIVENMANIIKEQMQDNIFISRHLTEKAFDTRSRDMNEDEKSTFIQAVEKRGGKVIVEGDHLHVQF